MVKIQELVKKFGDYTAVDNISLEIKEGEIFGLLGENGAGKTTTLRMIATMLKPTSGTIEVNGYNTVKNDIKVRNNIGILFGGETGLYDRLTARENIEYFGELYYMKKLELNQKINELSNLLGMDEYIDKKVANFSKGMKQKVAFARAIVHSPKVLLLDEPTSGLDVTAAVQVNDFILQSKKEGRTVIFSSHTMSEVEKLCDRVAIIHKGKLIEIGTLDELRNKYNNENLEKLFIELITEERG